MYNKSSDKITNYIAFQYSPIKFILPYSKSNPEDKQYLNPKDKALKITEISYYMDEATYDAIMPIIAEDRVIFIYVYGKCVARKICYPYVIFDAVAQRWKLVISNIRKLNI